MSVPVGPFIANMTVEGPVATGNPGGNPLLIGGLNSNSSVQPLSISGSGVMKFTAGGAGAAQSIKSWSSSGGGVDINGAYGDLLYCDDRQDALHNGYRRVDRRQQSGARAAQGRFYRGCRAVYFDDEFVVVDRNRVATDGGVGSCAYAGACGGVG